MIEKAKEKAEKEWAEGGEEEENQEGEGGGEGENQEEKKEEEKKDEDKEKARSRSRSKDRGDNKSLLVAESNSNFISIPAMTLIGFILSSSALVTKLSCRPAALTGYSEPLLVAH